MRFWFYLFTHCRTDQIINCSSGNRSGSNLNIFLFNLIFHFWNWQEMNWTNSAIERRTEWFCFVVLNRILNGFYRICDALHNTLPFYSIECFLVDRANQRQTVRAWIEEKREKAQTTQLVTTLYTYDLPQINSKNQHTTQSTLAHATHTHSHALIAELELFLQ